VDTPGGKVLLIDPWLQENPACPQNLKQIDRCDHVLLTHAHTDHMADALSTAKRTGAQIVAMVELAIWLQRKGAEKAVGMNKGGTARFGDIAVTLTHAFHSSSIHDGDQVLYGGEPAGLVVRLENGFTFYHAGDTAVFGDMALIAQLYRPELAMLPIGDHYTMGPKEAALAARLLKVKHLIPMHYGTFPALTGTPEELCALTRDIEGLTVHSLRPGDSLR
jgi:L-ascorbate metabolism protein UlaG (beta-lactamase superfamily)